MAGSDPSAGDETDVDLTALTLKERMALATTQQPAVALSVLVLLLFAFTFLIALALVFPRVAGLFILGTLLLSALAVGLFVLLRRLDAA